VPLHASSRRGLLRRSRCRPAPRCSRGHCRESDRGGRHQQSRAGWRPQWAVLTASRSRTDGCRDPDSESPSTSARTRAGTDDGSLRPLRSDSYRPTFGTVGRSHCGRRSRHHVYRDQHHSAGSMGRRDPRLGGQHVQLKARLRPMRGLKRFRSAAAIAAGHAFVQNLRRGHYELAIDATPHLRVRWPSSSSQLRSEPGPLSGRPCPARLNATAPFRLRAGTPAAAGT
jgi:hypothetical protein